MDKVELPCDVEPHPDVNGFSWGQTGCDETLESIARVTGAAAPTIGRTYEGTVGGPLPDSNPKSAYGVKKPPLLSCVPASALLVEGQVMALGAKKYGPFNWRGNSVAASVYVDALIRHAMAWNAGQDDDPESLVSHLGHVRACCGILIDAMETGNLIDDRPKDDATVRLLDTYTRK